EDLKTLLMYIVENFYSDFESITYVKTFKEMKIRYDQHRDKKERLLIDSGTPIQQQQNHDLALDNSNESGLDDAQASTTLDSTDDLSLISQQRNSTSYSRPNHLKSTISIHIRRPNSSTAPISSGGQFCQSSSVLNYTSYSPSSSPSNLNHSTTVTNRIHNNTGYDSSPRLDISSSSSTLRPSTSNESSSIAMSPGLQNIAQYQDQDSDEDDQNPTLEDEAEEETSGGEDIEINETLTNHVVKKPQIMLNTILITNDDNLFESNQSACVSSSSSISTESITQSEELLYHALNSTVNDINNSNNNNNNQYSDVNDILLTENSRSEETPSSSEEIISSSSTSSRKRNRSDNDNSIEDISVQETKLFCKRDQNGNNNVETTTENSNDLNDEEER
ncbi:unnamed protein product, partial [Didymodactylos carnosus]